MPSVAVERSGDDHRVDVFQFEQLSMIVEGLDVRRDLFRFVETASVYIGRRNEFGVRDFDEFLHQLLPPRAGADDAQSHTVVRAEYAAIGRRGQSRSRSRSHGAGDEGPAFYLRLFHGVLLSRNSDRWSQFSATCLSQTECSDLRIDSRGAGEGYDELTKESKKQAMPGENIYKEGRRPVKVAALSLRPNWISSGAERFRNQAARRFG